MCKIMIIPHVNNETRDNAIKFTEAMAKVMSEDKSHQDGLGYAAIDSQGNLFAERWLNNSQAFTNRAGRNANLNDYSGFIQFNYNKFGDVRLDDLGAITLHTRLATSGKGLLNCHPFIENDTSVIHNGVISNAFDHRIDQSTCDSEAILTQYADNGVGHDYELFNKVSTQLDGYYACGIFSRDSNGGRILDIVKSSSAQLVATYVDELQCVVFTSLEYQLKKGLDACGFKHNPVYTVNPSSMVRIDPLKNRVIGVTSFEEYERNYIKLVDQQEKKEEATPAKKSGKNHSTYRKGSYAKKSAYSYPSNYKYDWENDYYDPHYVGETGAWDHGEYMVKNSAKKGGK
jgi:hypothetical protein